LTYRKVVSPNRVRRIAANIAKLPDLLQNRYYKINR
jgi:hypothetical protein